MRRSPSRQPLNDWQRRLDGQLRTNLLGDLLAQVAIALAFVIHPSGWIVVLWVARWGVVAAIVAARRSVGSPEPTRPVFTVLGGHLAGALVITAIVPEFGAVTVLVVIGDLQMWSDYFPPTSHVAYRRLAALSIGVLSVLSLQSWTGLGEAVGPWLLIAFLIGHSSGVSLLIARQSWLVIQIGRRQGEELARSRKRLQLAEDETRRELSSWIIEGPRRRLERLRAQLARFAWARPTDLDAAVVASALGVAEALTSELREISLGLNLPEQPANNLAAALNSLPWGAAPRMRVTCDVEPAASEAARSALLEIAAEAAAWTRRSGSEVEAVTATRRGADLVFGLVFTKGRLRTQVDELRFHASDLAGAAAGRAQLFESARTVVLTGSIPETAGAAPSLTELRAGGTAAAMEPYLRGSIILTTVGVAAIGLAYVLYRNVQLVELALVVVSATAILRLAYRVLQTGQVLLAVALTSLESTIAAVGVMLLLPTMAPIVLVFCVLPLMVAPSITTVRQFLILMSVEQLTSMFAMFVLVFRRSTQLSDELFGWPTAVVLFTVSVAISVLVLRCYRATKLSLERDNALLQSSRSEVVAVWRAHRRELERDLHDSAQQFAVALAVRLRVLLRRLEHNLPIPAQAGSQLLELVDDADAALAELSSGSYPTALIEHGLVGGIERLARHCPHHTDVHFDVSRSLPAAVELTTYYCCSEALQNAAKHAGPGARVDVTVHEQADQLHFVISDTGRGFSRATISGPGRGLANLEARVDRLLGRIEIESVLGAGSIVRGWLPLDPLHC